ncbi:MAG: ABC-F family ATP-binding cassette domain-containing protein [Lactobacillus sp.]|nr:ABC-F family ATP-binding cassette domain-containing protein [Lactobacillus sp.]
MIIAQGHELEKQFGSTTLFSHVNFSIKKDSRIGLVGPNGVGKTTLLKILMNQESATHGDFSVNKGVSVGYLAQENILKESNTVFSEMEQVFLPLINQGKDLLKLQEAMADDPQNKELLEKYDKQQFAFEQAGGYTYQTDIKSILQAFKFDDSMWTLEIASLSGGQKTRLAFVKLLLEKPDLLLLDEPTNYLDLETLDWLEGFLKNYPGAIFVVSHDQYFLDRLTTETFELNHGSLTCYKGNYSAFQAQKALEEQTQLASYEKQQAKIKREEEFIQKNIVRSSTTKRAQSRRKQLEKLELIEKPQNDQVVKIRFSQNRPTGKEVLVIKDLATGYDSVMLQGLNMQVNKGDRVAIIGPNGIGKSTLLKTIVKEIPAKAGEIKYGANLDLGYYDQELKRLDPKENVLDTIWNRHKDMLEKDVRSILASFLFKASDLEKLTSTLSGGQKARLTLTLLSLEHDNLLIMDEPTNHLDLDSKQVLEDSLKDYDGTLLFVSHDRHFINKLATKILVLDHHQSHFYEGNYEDYLRHQIVPEEHVEAVKEESQEKLSYQEQKKRDSEKRKLERTISQCENDIDRLEAEKAELETEMAKPENAASFDKLGPLQERISEIELEVQKLTDLWEETSMQLEEFE